MFARDVDVANLIGPGRPGKPRKEDVKTISKKLGEIYPFVINHSMTLESLEPQVGKSRLECSIIWLQKFVHHRNVIFVLDDKLNSLNQFQIRDFPSFNSFIDSLGMDDSIRYHLKPKVLMASTPLKTIDQWFVDNEVIVTTINCRRLATLHRYLQKNVRTRFVLIYDEADMRFADMKEKPTVQKEKFAREVEKYARHVYYVTATAFACANSPYRRKSLYRPIMPKVGEGMEFRGYQRFTKNFVDTASLKPLRELADNPVWIDFVNNVSQARYDSQPPIALVNIAQKVTDHDIIAKSIIKLNKDAVVLVYNNTGVVDHESGKKRALFVHTEDGTKRIKARIISQALQHFKDRGCRQPIFIVAGKRASRAETFKSVDHQWVLTRMLLTLPSLASMESIVQYLRVCGIYNVDAPLATVDISAVDHMQVRHCLENKKIMAKNFDGHRNLRVIIPKLKLYKVKGGFTRAECEDGDLYCPDKQKCCYETSEKKKLVTYMESTFPDRRIIWLTKRHTLEVATEDFPYIAQFRENGDLKCLALIRKGQTNLQSFIWKELLTGQYATTKTTLQIAYSKEREKDLNSNPLTRPKQKYADYIAVTMGMDAEGATLHVPVVEYLHQRDEFEEDDSIVYAWHTTFGTYRCAISKDDTLQVGYYVRA